MVTKQIMKNIFLVILLGIVLLFVVAVLTIYSVRKSLLPMENMKKFIKVNVIGSRNCQKQKDETEEIRYLIRELEEQFIGVIRQTKEESGNIKERMQDTNDSMYSISENMTQETKGVLESVNNLQATMQEFHVS